VDIQENKFDDICSDDITEVPILETDGNEFVNDLLSHLIDAASFAVLKVEQSIVIGVIQEIRSRKVFSVLKNLAKSVGLSWSESNNTLAVCETSLNDTEDDNEDEEDGIS